MIIDHITIRNTFIFAHKLSVKEPLLSDWLTFTSSNWIASVEKALDGDAVLIVLTNSARRSKKLE
jgi:hypothetical protein